MTTSTKTRATNTGRYIAGGLLGGPLIFILTQAWLDSGKETQGAVITESAKDSEFLRNQFILAMQADAANDTQVIATNTLVANKLVEATQALTEVAKTNKTMTKRIDILIGYVDDEVQETGQESAQPN